MSVRLAALPADIEAAAYAAAYSSPAPVFVVWTGDEWQLTDVEPNVPCWAFKVPQAA